MNPTCYVQPTNDATLDTPRVRAIRPPFWRTLLWLGLALCLAASAHALNIVQYVEISGVPGQDGVVRITIGPNTLEVPIGKDATCEQICQAIKNKIAERDTPDFWKGLIIDCLCSAGSQKIGFRSRDGTDLGKPKIKTEGKDERGNPTGKEIPGVSIDPTEIDNALFKISNITGPPIPPGGNGTNRWTVCIAVVINGLTNEICVEVDDDISGDDAGNYPSTADEIIAEFLKQIEAHPDLGAVRDAEGQIFVTLGGPAIKIIRPGSIRFPYAGPDNQPYPEPLLRSVNPGAGGLQGNYSVTLHCSSMGPGAEILFNGLPVPALAYDAERDSYTVLVPPSATAGPVQVAVIPPGGDRNRHNTIENGFVYRPQLEVVHLGRNHSGALTEVGADGYMFIGGGNDAWDNMDECSFAAEPVWGDFDVQVRVASLEANSRWTKAGLMVRENLSESGRMAFNRVTPPPVPTSDGDLGANDSFFAYRTGQDEGERGGANGGRHQDGEGAPEYPNAWLRVQRVGNVIVGYRSMDGVNWLKQGEQDTATWAGGPLPEKVLVGPAVSKGPSGGPTATAEFRDYQIQVGTNKPTYYRVESASSEGNPSGVKVVFSRPVRDDATNLWHWSISPGSITGAQFSDPDVIWVRTAMPLIEGRTYTFTISNVFSHDFNEPLESNPTVLRFTHGAGYEARRIRLERWNFIPGGSVEPILASQAYARDLPDMIYSNSLFEDTTPEAQNDFSGRIFGVLNITNTGDYRFFACSDDSSRLYLSTDDQPANKIEIAREPEWNGPRQYATTDRRGASRANVSAPVRLEAGKRYWLEQVFADGSQGNNASVAWQPPGAPEPGNGALPIPESAFVRARYFKGTIFHTLGKPMFIEEPQSQTVSNGQVATFAVRVDGTPPYAYQWQLGSGAGFEDIPGATNARYAHLASWWDLDKPVSIRCRVSNPFSSATSAVATLTVLGCDLHVTQQPADATVFAGQSATFHVAATGTPAALTYQWQEDRGDNFGFRDIPAATNATYFLRALRDDGYLAWLAFRCRVGNGCTNVFSDSARLTVLPCDLVITRQPAHLAVFPGQTATFAIEATGTPAELTYQWQAGPGSEPFTNLPPATGPTLTLTASLMNNGTQFRCVVGNDCTTVVSDAATLTVVPPPPAHDFAALGLSLTPLGNGVYAVTPQLGITLTSSNEPIPADFLLRVNGALLYDGRGLQSASSVIICENPDCSGGCNIRIDGQDVSGTCQAGSPGNQRGCGCNVHVALSAVSLALSPGDVVQLVLDPDNRVAEFSESNNTFSITVPLPEPPAIVAPPQSVSVTAGLVATFRVRASGTPPLAYQWRFNGSAVPGANADQLDIPFAAIAHEGDYDVVVTNPFGSVTSATAQLSVIATNPAARTGTVLIFEPADDLKPVPESYGDRVTGWLDAQGNRYAPGSGGTPNVTVEYGPTGSFVRLATGPYGALANVACQEDGDFGALEIQLSADPGFQVALRGFDLATLADDVILPRVEVLGSYGVTLHAADDVSVPGLGGTSTRFDFDAAPLVSGRILIRIDLSSLDDTDSHLVGIDNIGFSQVVGSGCPPPPLLAISRSGRNIVLSWPGTGYRLETATTLADVPAASAWTAVAGTSPVTLPMAASGAQFFRLVCP